jgi:NAD(P)-dependent dehydrogenase (short-subunit alcohol dehydrogenase family)
MNKIIITGAKGLLGSTIAESLKKNFEVVGLDLVLGQDLTDEKFVKDINCFALNDHVEVNEQRSDLFNVSLKGIEKYLLINVISLFSVCREFSRNEQAKGIINFSSTYGVVSPIPQLYKNGEKHIGYSISKGAVIQLTKHLACHLAPKIRVNCIVPGGVDNKQDEQFKKDYSERVPMKRMMNKNELNGIIKYLCSEESSYMTGSIIKIDGGWTAW